jgi:two-component system chemotaxis response regulator CheB
VATRDHVVVGASAGGVESLRELVRDLGPDLPAAVLIVLHMPTNAFSALPTILDRVGGMPVAAAEDGATLVPGKVVVAPPNRHLMIRGDRVSLGPGPKENGHRPAIDALFRSAARWAGPRVVGVVLSGSLDDGAAGLLTIAQRGGVAVVQDPATSLYDGMPRAALRAVPDAFVGSGPELAKAIWRLCLEEVEEKVPPVERELEIETDIAILEEAAMTEPHRPGKPAPMSCPNCSGAMFMFDQGSMLRYRCRVGHAWSPQALMSSQLEAAEAALWAAIRTLEEKGALHRNLAEHREGAHSSTAAYHWDRAAEVDQAAAVIRNLLRNPLVAHELDPPVELRQSQ